MTRTALAMLTVALSLWGGGCSLPPSQDGFDSDDPQQRTRALAEATRSNDAQSIPDLIGMLESSDPAQRMLAIRSLEHLTGETFGYDFAAPAWERAPAVDRWVAWELNRNRKSSVPVRSAGG